MSKLRIIRFPDSTQRDFQMQARLARSTFYGGDMAASAIYHPTRYLPEGTLDRFGRPHDMDIAFVDALYDIEGVRQVKLTTMTVTIRIRDGFEWGDIEAVVIELICARDSVEYAPSDLEIVHYLHRRSGGRELVSS